MDTVYHIWNEVLGHFVFWLLTLGAGVAITFLKRREWSWTSPVMYGLGAAVLVASVLLAFQANSKLAEHPITLTADNAKTLCREWLEADTQVSTRELSQSEAPSDIFSLMVSTPDGNRLLVTRPREWDREVHISKNIAIESATKSALEALPADDSDLLREEITAELLRSKSHFAITPWERIQIYRTIFLTGDVTEEAFLSDMADVENTSQIIRNMMTVALNRADRARAKTPKK